MYNDTFKSRFTSSLFSSCCWNWICWIYLFFIDQDECQIDNGGCAEKCINNIGSYDCECNKAGYALISDSKPCEGLFLFFFFFFECCIYYLSSLVGFFFPNIENISGSLFKMLLALGCGSCFIDSFDQV